MLLTGLEGWLFWVRATALKGRELTLEQAEKADSCLGRLVVSRTGEGLTKSSDIAMIFGHVPILSVETKLETLSSSHHHVMIQRVPSLQQASANQRACHGWEPQPHSSDIRWFTAVGHWNAFSVVSCLKQRFPGLSLIASSLSQEVMAGV